MATADGNFRITFNGEIYNCRELRKELEAKGYRFRSNSDTEVLLHLYAERGPDMVHALRGMYAFGIWDERKKGIFLADARGIRGWAKHVMQQASPAANAYVPATAQ